LHAKDRETFPNTRLRFLEALKNNDWPLRHTLTIHTADGQPYIEVYTPLSRVSAKLTGTPHAFHVQELKHKPDTLGNSAGFSVHTWN
jgi:hypothetical protein